MKFVVVSLAFSAIACGPPPPSGNGSRNSGGGRDAGTLPDSGQGNDAGQIPTQDAGAVLPEGELINPDCVDGQYRETLPTVEASIDEATANYTADNWRGYVEQVLMQRYPLGWHLINRAIIEAPEQFGDCMNRFLGASGSAAQINRQIGTFVHECGHFLDVGLGWGRSEDFYVVNSGLTISCSQGDSIERGGRTFARSRINNDSYSALRPPCGGAGSSENCDNYADTYLDGNPDDNEFEGGDQGFNMLLEEAFQYVNSLATNYALADTISGSISGRDGILTHLWWVQRYLKYARDEHPQAHQFLMGDPCWRRAILTLWGRAWLYLSITEDMDSLGINHRAIEPLIEDSDLMAEIEALRQAHGCP
jgi:hypothetical protein